MKTKAKMKFKGLIITSDEYRKFLTASELYKITAIMNPNATTKNDLKSSVKAHCF